MFQIFIPAAPSTWEALLLSHLMSLYSSFKTELKRLLLSEAVSVSPPHFTLWVLQVVPAHQLSPNRFVLTYSLSTLFGLTFVSSLEVRYFRSLQRQAQSLVHETKPTQPDRETETDRQKSIEPPTAKSPLWVTEGIVSGVRCSPRALDGTTTRVKDRTQSIWWSKDQQECFDVRNWKSSQTLPWPVAQRWPRPSL